MAKKKGRPGLDPEKVEAVRKCIDEGKTPSEAVKLTTVSVAKVYELYRRYKPRRGKAS